MDWGLLLEAEGEAIGSIIGLAIGVVVSLYKIREIKSGWSKRPRLRSTLKTDLELLKMLKSDPRNKDILQAHINATIDRIYRRPVPQGGSKRLEVHSWSDFIFGICFFLGFSLWTGYLLKGGFNWWVIITGFFAFAGLGGLASAFEEHEPTKPKEDAKEIMEMADTKEIKTKQTMESKLVAYTIHKGSYNKLGEAFQRLSQWISKNGFEIIGHPTDIYYNDPNTSPEEELLTEVQIPIKRK